MRQVPHYSIIGNGRMARHMLYYLTLSHIPHNHWYRHCQHSLKDIISSSSHILILITDDAINPFIHQHPYLQAKTLIHCSGSLVSSYAHSAHPLCTFASTLFTIDQYQQIPFILEQEGPTFRQLFPQLSNPAHSIPAQLKPLYHSLCVMANNFSTILWQKLFKEFELQLGLPAQCAFPLLQHTLHNLTTDYHTALTGPLARNDIKTLTSNLNALKNDPYHQLYQSFITTFKEDNCHENL